jgi:Photosynthetic reaction centre cytochrome C subunit
LRFPQGLAHLLYPEGKRTLRAAKINRLLINTEEAMKYNDQLRVLRFLVIVALAGGGLALAARGSLAQSQPSAAPPEQTAEQVYRNIQVFKGLPASQLYPAMNFITGALGVNCTHCHTPNQFEKDDKAAKQTARRMMEMTQTLNRSSFGDAPSVTCYTCHRGQARPVSAPTVTPAAVPLPPASETLPTLDELLDKYVLALGGKAKLEQVATLTMKGTEAPSGAANGQAARTLEVYRKAPDKLLLLNTQTGTSATRAFDGKTGWQQFDGRTMGMSATDLGMIRREAQFDQNYNFRGHYTKLTLSGRAQLGAREAWVIEATPLINQLGPMPVESERLYLDTRSGLLLRRQIEVKTALGRISFATDFDDYREVDGVKWPFTIQQLFPNFGVTQRFTEIKLNVPLADDRFTRPAPK